MKLEARFEENEWVQNFPALARMERVNGHRKTHRESSGEGCSLRPLDIVMFLLNPAPCIESSIEFDPTSRCVVDRGLTFRDRFPAKEDRR